MHAVRQQEKLVMVMLDLDAFKSFNDIYVLMAGD
ncbi:MAG: GGDEF domain-containing protein [Thiopseudomonas sp.]|nr:GGDEF domain-containing protein [Thiopseudomonas sp.]